MVAVISYGPLVGCYYSWRLLDGCLNGGSYSWRLLGTMETCIPRELKMTPGKMASDLKIPPGTTRHSPSHLLTNGGGPLFLDPLSLEPKKISPEIERPKLRGPF